MTKSHPTIGCCGIDCALCPRYYTKGNSICPGCLGEYFEKSRPPCPIANCCYKKNNHEVCGQCNDYPCNRWDDKDKVEKDSFVTHKRALFNQDFIKNHGLETFISQQQVRIGLLETLLNNYNDNRSKNFYCLATALLSLESINDIINYIKENNNIEIATLKEKINHLAKEENIVLKLIKK